MRKYETGERAIANEELRAKGENSSHGASMSQRRNKYQKKKHVPGERVVANEKE